LRSGAAGGVARFQSTAIGGPQFAWCPQRSGPIPQYYPSLPLDCSLSSLGAEYSAQFFLRAVEHRAPNPSEIYALDFKRDFDDPRFARVQRLSASIGRFFDLHNASPTSAKRQNTVSPSRSRLGPTSSDSPVHGKAGRSCRAHYSGKEHQHQKNGINRAAQEIADKMDAGAITAHGTCRACFRTWGCEKTTFQRELYWRLPAGPRRLRSVWRRRAFSGRFALDCGVHFRAE
jgi:hypothetical protein